MASDDRKEMATGGDPMASADALEEALMIFEHWQRNKHAKTQEGCAMDWPEISFATWRLRVKAGEKLYLLMRAGKLSRKFSN